MGRIKDRSNHSVDDLFDDLREYADAIMYDSPNDYSVIYEFSGEVPKHIHEFRYSLVALLTAIDLYYDNVDNIVRSATNNNKEEE